MVLSVWDHDTVAAGNIIGKDLHAFTNPCDKASFKPSLGACCASYLTIMTSSCTVTARGTLRKLHDPMCYRPT